LIGDDGLLPAKDYWKSINATFENKMVGFQNVPSLLWFLPDGTDIATTIQLFSQIGMTLSLFVLVSGRANAVLMFLLWSLYFSIDSVGQRWYSFGWESQLLETGFLAIFVSPLVSLLYNDQGTGGWVVVWGYRWLIFRILLGAGLIKIRGDACWTSLTCMDSHYETQPLPGPFSRWFHQNPQWFHILETGANHVVELIVPFLMLMSRSCRLSSGCLQILFQCILISSGNLSFLNWLTILPSLWCFDDTFLMDITDFIQEQIFSCLPSKVTILLQTCIRTITSYDLGMAMKERLYKEQVSANTPTPTPTPTPSSPFTLLYGVIGIALACLISFESIPVVHNLLALDGRQAMNTNFNAFKVVNTYGAFGSITKERTEIILEGTSNINPNDPNTVWIPYEFKCKPGAIDRRPCLITPYHLRLDWLMWFAAFGNYQQHPWLLHLTAKLLVNDPLVSSLIAINPFLEDEKPPTFIRAEHYVYEYSIQDDDTNWWKRKRKGEYFPAVSLQHPSFQKFLEKNGWNTTVNINKKKKKTKK